MWGFPGGSVVKNPSANAGDTGDVGWIHEPGRSPGGGNGNPPQCSCLENSMDRGTWQATVHGVAKLRHDWATEHTYTLLSYILNLVSQFHLLHQSQEQHKQWKLKLKVAASPCGSRKKATKVPSEETTIGIAVGTQKNHLTSWAPAVSWIMISSVPVLWAAWLGNFWGCILSSCNSWCLHSLRGNPMVPCLHSLQHERTTKNMGSVLLSQGSVTIQIVFRFPNRILTKHDTTQVTL